MTHLSAHKLWIIYRQQRRAVPLDLKGAVVRPERPLTLALTNSLPLRRPRIETVVMKRHERGRTLSGFVQARWRTGQPVLDVVYIAPSLESQPGTTWLWQSLLHELVRVSGSEGAQRLFAHLPEARPGEVEVMRQAGFALYGQDRLYEARYPQLPARPAVPFWSPRTATDEWGLIRLYHAITPAVVQQAETWGQPTNGDGSTHAIWWGGTRRRNYVLRGAEAGEVLGFLRITPGERGHWVKMILHPDASHRAEPLLREALSLLNNFPRRPIYCDVREYEGYLTDSLERCGFQRLMTRLLLVRHTTVAVREVVRRPIPALDVETAPTVSTSLQARPVANGHEGL